MCWTLSHSASAKVCIIRLFAVGGICFPCRLFLLCAFESKRHMSRAYNLFMCHKSYGHLRMAQVALVYRHVVIMTMMLDQPH